MARWALQVCWDWNTVTMCAGSPCRGQSQARSCSPCPPCCPLDKGGMCVFFWLQRRRMQTFPAATTKPNGLNFSCLLRRKTAVSGLQHPLKDHQTTRFVDTPVGNGSVKAQILDAHPDMPEQGQTEGCIQKGHRGAWVNFAGESLSWGRWQEVSSPLQAFAGKCFS